MNLNESDAYPLTDRAEVEECRRLMENARAQGYRYPPPDWYDSAAELGAARDLEFWGCNPFEEC